MTKIEVLTDRARWQHACERRRVGHYAAAGYPAAAVDRLLDEERGRMADWTVAEITAAGDCVGFVAVAVREDNGAPTGLVGDLWVSPEHAGAGHERAARDWAEEFCRAAGAVRIAVRIFGGTGPFADYGLRSQGRIRTLTEPAVVPGVTARRMTPDEYPHWLATEQEGYVAGLLRAGGLREVEARAKSDADYGRLLPDGLNTANTSILVLEHEGRPVGSGWLRHDHLPGVTYGYGVRIDPGARGRGLGRAAIAAGEAATLAAGDAALTFTVWEGNTVAMNLYTAAGYRVAHEYRSKDLAH
ncbi:GNAT family N-acetyltransferase [Kitasatospora nipponensis]|uniref:GNAT family N-acetyltransferase n=1 Tax=Kitasatospora nipponensis TaxID=258049 RepID=A0ABN1WZ35_9ACTN